MKTFYRIPIVAALLTLTASVLTDLLESPPMRWAVSAYNFLIDLAVLTLDYLTPTSPLVASGIATPIREVRHLTQGIHRRAQPRLHQTDPSDPTDDDDGNDMQDNGLRESMRC